MNKLGSKHTKLHNSNLVFGLIYYHNNISRADLSRLTKLTRSTISIIVDDFIQQGIVKENGLGVSTGGKRPTLLSVEENSRDIIGLDLTNNVYRGSIFNLKGKSCFSSFINLEDDESDSNFNKLSTLIDILIQQSTKPLLGIGIGAPGIIDNRSGTILRASNKAWHDVHLSDILHKRFNHPILVANDSHASALAEYLYSLDKKTDNLILLKVGSGIGVGIVIDGKLHLGDNSASGEIGHIASFNGGEKCICGKYGCLETVASIPAILKQAQAILIQNHSSYLNQMVSSPNSLTLPEINQAIKNEDRYFKQLISNVGNILGYSLANIVSLLNINCGFKLLVQQYY